MGYAAFYTTPLIPAGIFLAAVLLLLIVPVFAVAVLAVVLLAGLVLAMALAGAIVAAPLLIASAARSHWAPRAGAALVSSGTAHDSAVARTRAPSPSRRRPRHGMEQPAAIQAQGQQVGGSVRP